MQGQDPNNTDAKRFWSKVDIKGPDDCWNWKAALRGEYGSFYLTRIERYAHRAAWILTNGEIPKGMDVLHKCDNKKCVNPNHLYVGTQVDNWRDIKERLSYNLKKRSPEEIEQIRDLRSHKFTLCEIGELFNIHHSTVINYCRQ